ncbi:MAG: DUF4388 domain-containing protein [Oscillochloris sp.]|nr:DUF4388 domain-containing protein [Oscillochloris sp.]
MALEGTLQDMSLSDLFQVFRMGPKTGILLLVSGAERGLIYVTTGRPIDAAVMRGAERQVVAVHDEAVIRMLLWDDANFVFRHDPAVGERPIKIAHDSEWLVMEGMRRRDDPASAMPYQKITLDTQLQLSPLPGTAESGVSLDVNQWRILSQVAGSPNVRTICDATSIQPEQAIRIIAELLSIGLVEIVAPLRKAPPLRPRQDPVRAMVPAGTPVLAGTGGAVGSVDESSEPVVARGLLDAIMRRIRGL